MHRFVGRQLIVKFSRVNKVSVGNLLADMLCMMSVHGGLPALGIRHSIYAVFFQLSVTIF